MGVGARDPPVPPVSSALKKVKELKDLASSNKC